MRSKIWDRPSDGSPEVVVTGTIGDGRMAQRERGGREDVGGPARIALPGEDVEDDVGGVDALGDRLGASGLDRRQPVGEHRGEDVDHLPIAVVDTGELAPHALSELEEAEQQIADRATAAQTIPELETE